MMTTLKQLTQVVKFYTSNSELLSLALSELIQMMSYQNDSCGLALA